MNSRQWLALGVAFFTVAGILLRPPRLREGGVAVLGAFLALSLSLISPVELLRSIRSDLDVLVFFLGLMLVAQGAEEAGLFRWLSATALNRARGSPRRLFVHLCVTGTLVAALFSNDAAVLLLTPSVLAETPAENPGVTPYLLACTFIADSASAILPVSNPVNLLVLERLHLSYRDYLLHLTFPGLVAAIVAGLLMLLVFRRELACRPVTAGAAPYSAEQHTNCRRQNAALFAFVVLGAAYLVFALAGWPLGVVTLIVGLALAVLINGRQPRAWARTVAGISWQALGLVVGLLVVVQALTSTGVAGVLAAPLARLQGAQAAVALAVMAVAVAAAANLINNWPAILVALALLGSGNLGASTHAASYGAVLGADIGAKLTLVGSLATVLWLALLRRRGVPLNAWTYLRTAVLITPAVLAAAMLTAALTLF